MKRFIALAVLIGAIAALKFLPFWAIVVGLVVLVVGLRYLIPWMGKRFLVSLFDAKSRALRGATARVHSISEVDPFPLEEGAEPDPAKRHFEAELTVIPTPSGGPFHGWEPGELRVVAHDAKPVTEESDDDSGCQTQVVKTRDGDNAWEPYEGEKFAGPRTLLVRLAVPPALTALKVRYYFEELGPLALPPDAVPIARLELKPRKVS